RKGVVDKIRRARVFGARKLFFVKIDQLPLNRVSLHGEVGVPIGRELFISALDHLGVIAVDEFTDRLLGYRRILFRQERSFRDGLEKRRKRVRVGFDDPLGGAVSEMKTRYVYLGDVHQKTEPGIARLQRVRRGQGPRGLTAQHRTQDGGNRLYVDETHILVGD